MDWATAQAKKILRIAARLPFKQFSAENSYTWLGSFSFSKPRIEPVRLTSSVVEQIMMAGFRNFYQPKKKKNKKKGKPRFSWKKPQCALNRCRDLTLTVCHLKNVEIIKKRVTCARTQL